jgi:hypothetical protein
LFFGAGCDDQFEFALDLLLDEFDRLQQEGWTSTKIGGSFTLTPEHRMSDGAIGGRFKTRWLSAERATEF